MMCDICGAHMHQVESPRYAYRLPEQGRLYFVEDEKILVLCENCRIDHARGVIPDVEDYARRIF
jgi:hypothetical protein